MRYACDERRTKFSFQSTTTTTTTIKKEKKKENHSRYGLLHRGPVVPLQYFAHRIVDLLDISITGRIWFHYRHIFLEMKENNDDDDDAPLEFELPITKVEAEELIFLSYLSYRTLSTRKLFTS